MKSPGSANHKDKRTTLIGLFLLGVILVAAGIVSVEVYSTDFSSNLTDVETGITTGWSSQVVSNPGIRMTIFPDFYGYDFSVMMVVITGSVYTNQSNGAIFSMLTPFWITNILGEDSGESGLDGLTANWSFHNVSNNASIIQYSVQPIGDCSVIPCAGPIDASFTVAFNHLLFVDDHGKYTAIIPFEGYPFRTVKMLPLNFSTLVDLTNKVNFNLEFRDNLIFTGSTPAYSYAGVSYGLSKASLEYSYPSIGASTLTFTFEDPGEASNQQLAQALGFTLIGLGIPIAISTFVEWRKSSRPDGSNRDLSEDKFRDDREPDITG